MGLMKICIEMWQMDMTACGFVANESITLSHILDIVGCGSVNLIMNYHNRTYILNSINYSLEPIFYP